MDKTKEYIKMCDCPEIQELWKPIEGDVYVFLLAFKLSTPKIFIHQEKFEQLFDNIKELIWLPRQDQLQAMIAEDNWIRTQVAFYDFIFRSGSNLCAEHFKDKCLQEISEGFKDGELIYEKSIEAISETWNSFEQLWLAFVMKEKFGRTWNGDKWIAE